MKTKQLAAFVIAPALIHVGLSAETDPEKTQTSEDKATTVVETAIPGSVVKMIDDSATFSILKKAIDAAGLRGDLESIKTVTVFAPTDEAFMKLPEGTLEKLMLPENKEKLRSLLMYHAIAGERTALSFEDSEVTSLSGDKLEVDLDDNEVEVNDAKVVNTDLRAGNGIIHVIDEVLVPESLDDFAGLDD
ncbi:osteoblast specific factor 2-related protein [Haloferula helveola]|uniref:Osteoblast specific factor 2-related protein n=1 Tax=Haloferula helveola TaxID=490095 RepID=A0ABN6H9P7_9BACT|nr:osteoblast specific factor 2-related protein [Haloferula helveola]